MTALIVILVMVVVTSLASVFGGQDERAAMHKDERGWWPGTPRKR